MISNHFVPRELSPAVETKVIIPDLPRFRDEIMPNSHDPLVSGALRFELSKTRATDEAKAAWIVA